MSENKLRQIPIKDFLFVGLSEHSKTLNSGFFTPNNTKICFQMPRKVQKLKKLIDSRKVEISFKRKGDASKVPMSAGNKKNEHIVFHSLNQLINSQRPSIETSNSPSNVVSIANLKTASRIRPKTSVVSARKSIKDDGILNSQLLFGQNSERKKIEKIDIFIKSPKIQLSDSITEDA